MQKANVFRITFIGLVIIHFINVVEQCFGSLTVWIHLLIFKFHAKHAFFPDFYINDSAIMLFILGLFILMIVIGTLIVLEVQGARILALMLASFDFFYGLAPLTIGIYFRKYFPGMISATLMIMLSFLVIYFDYLMMNPLVKEIGPENDTDLET